MLAFIHRIYTRLKTPIGVVVAVFGFPGSVDRFTQNFQWWSGHYAPIAEWLRGHGLALMVTQYWPLLFLVIGILLLVPNKAWPSIALVLQRGGTTRAFSKDTPAIQIGDAVRDEAPHSERLYQVPIAVLQEYPHCSVAVYFDGIDPSGPGIAMRWQSNYGHQGSGLSTRTLRPGVENWVPVIFRTDRQRVGTSPDVQILPMQSG
jgi:hypothetical protein